MKDKKKYVLILKDRQDEQQDLRPTALGERDFTSDSYIHQTKSNGFEWHFNEISGEARKQFPRMFKVTISEIVFKNIFVEV